MPTPLVEAKVLYENPEARQLHATGLDSELAGQFDEAHQAFGAAQMILDFDPLTVDSQVQRARIIRDDGFTYARRAIAAHSTQPLTAARTRLRQSLALTNEVLVGGIADRASQFLEEVLQADDTGEASLQPVPPAKAPMVAETSGEHGATYSLLARVATVNAVMQGVDLRANADTPLVINHLYETAHGYLRQGNNGYYRTSNAMTAARGAVLTGRAGSAAWWWNRAAAGVVWTAVHDEGNFVRAAQTFGVRSAHLLVERDPVRASVLAKP